MVFAHHINRRHLDCEVLKRDTMKSETVLKDDATIVVEEKGPKVRFPGKSPKQGGRARNVARRKAKRRRNRNHVRAIGK